MSKNNEKPSLLEHNNKKKNPDKNVNVSAKSVTRSEAGFGDSKQIPSFDVTMRMTNHTRNAILSLAQMKSDDGTANGMISELVDDFVHKMNDDDFQQYQELFNMLEKKDELSFKLKSK